MSRWSRGDAEPTLDDLMSYADNEALALNLIEEPTTTLKRTLRTPEKANVMPPPPSAVPPSNARRVSSHSSIFLQSDVPEVDEGAFSDKASTEGDTDATPFALNVLEQLALTSLRGSFSSSNTPGSSWSASSSQASQMHAILNEVVVDDYESNNQAPSPSMTDWSEIAIHRLSEEQRTKQRITRMRAQMQLTISRLQKQNEDLTGALAVAKDKSAKREKQLVADHTFKVSTKERQISQLKRQVTELSAAAKTNQAKLEAEVADLKAQVADLKFENKLMQTAYENGRSAYQHS